MSKASTYANALSAAGKQCPTAFVVNGRDGLWGVKASVTHDGQCVIEKNRYTISPENAVALARWILDTFGDE